MWLLSDKVTIAESGILEGMTDWHCHLIPNVDDGVEDQEEAKAILHLWEEAGVSEVWLTPHIMEDIPNKVEDLRESFSVMSQYYHGSI